MKKTFKWIIIIIGALCTAYTLLIMYSFFYLKEDVSCRESPVYGSYSSDRKLELLHVRVSCRNEFSINNKIYIRGINNSEAYLIFEGLSEEEIDFGLDWVGPSEIEILIPSYISILNSKKHQVDGYSISYRLYQIPFDRPKPKELDAN